MVTTLVLLALAILFATAATAWAGAFRSTALRAKFEALGVITGRAQAEILRHVGEPHRRHQLGAGCEVLVSQRINFRVALHFTDGVCDGVDHDSGG